MRAREFIGDISRRGVMEAKSPGEFVAQLRAQSPDIKGIYQKYLKSPHYRPFRTSDDSVREYHDWTDNFAQFLRKEFGHMPQDLQFEIGNHLYDYIKMRSRGDPESVAEGNNIKILLKVNDQDNTVDVTAILDGQEVGHVNFDNSQGELIPQDLYVDPEYRGQGIAAAMYNYTKRKGYTILQGEEQSDDSVGFWAKHRPGKKVWEQGVAEGLNEFDAQGYQQRYTLYKDGFELEKFSDLDDAIEWAEDDRRDGDDPTAVYKIVDINGRIVWDSNPHERGSRTQFKKSDRDVFEGKMAELEMDIEDPEISDRQFEKMYGMTRREARELFSKTNMWDHSEVRDPTKPLHEQGVAEGKKRRRKSKSRRGVYGPVPWMGGHFFGGGEGEGGGGEG